MGDSNASHDLKLLSNRSCIDDVVIISVGMGGGNSDLAESKVFYLVKSSKFTGVDALDIS
jgi:hypothetical protein